MEACVVNSLYRVGTHLQANAGSANAEGDYRQGVIRKVDPANDKFRYLIQFGDRAIGWRSEHVVATYYHPVKA